LLVYIHIVRRCTAHTTSNSLRYFSLLTRLEPTLILPAMYAIIPRRVSPNNLCQFHIMNLGLDTPVTRKFHADVLRAGVIIANILKNLKHCGFCLYHYFHGKNLGILSTKTAYKFHRFSDITD
jgi:hypothetical protein